jgi:hypothetical protein
MAVKRKVLISEASKDEKQDSDIEADSSFSSESQPVSTSSFIEEDSYNVFVDPDAPEHQFIRNGVPDTEEDFEEINMSLRKVQPWVEDIDDVHRHRLRITLFQHLVTQCPWLDQRYKFGSEDAYNLANDLFEANPDLVSEIDKSWSDPEGSFLRISHFGEYCIPFNF